ncbi:MAG: L-2-amino-thiazoline-4-carboxylic acid hydrolase [Anaerolinea sp.]|jgi:hypothetical protein|nr:L-2-amino-thiazoline-4-carboxylic acid hydrolase [Anaerolinea sp.]
MVAVDLLFRGLGKPLTVRAARRAIVGRNRSRYEPEKGRFTTAEINRILNQTWKDFGLLLPNLPREPTLGSRISLKLAALTLTFFRNLTTSGIEARYALELVSDVCWRIFQQWGHVVKRVYRLFGIDIVGLYSQHAQLDGSWTLGFPFNPPGFLARYTPVEGGVGFNVVRCPIAEFMRSQGASDLAVGTWCMLDYSFLEMQGLRLERSKTLAKGDKECDFRLYPNDQ